MLNFRVGEFIEFGKPNGLTRYGHVVKINGYTIKVDVGGVNWTVATQFCRTFNGSRQIKDAASEIRDVSRKVIVSSKDFNVGDRVSFGRDNGQRTIGIVTKVNPKNLKVRSIESRGRIDSGVEWNVHPKLCTLVEPVKEEVVTQVEIETVEQLKVAKYFAACV
jgi:hypothetical protein